LSRVASMIARPRRIDSPSGPSGIALSVTITTRAVAASAEDVSDVVGARLPAGAGESLPHAADPASTSPSATPTARRRTGRPAEDEAREGAVRDAVARLPAAT
ncbi:MAG: hypothetical protein ACYC2G_16070, partial [Gemmatimonadaceae bacterium]